MSSANINIMHNKEKIFHKMENNIKNKEKSYKEYLKMKKEILGRNSINNEKYKINIAKKYNFYFQKRKKEIIILIILILKIFFPVFILNKKIENIRQLNLPWEISLKIKGTGQQNILYDQTNNGKSFDNAPSEILVNGDIQTPTDIK